MDLWQILCDGIQEAWLDNTRGLAEWLLEQPRQQVLAAGSAGAPRRGSTVCAWTMRLLSAVELALGDGSPDHGDRLAVSAAKFDEVSAQIAAFDPNDGWQGAAAQAYLAQSRAQSRRVKLMGDLDQQTGKLVSAQAEAVERVRDVVVGERIGLVATYFFCVWSETTGGLEGQALSLQVALGACLVALIVLAAFMDDLCDTTSQNESELQSGIQRLTDMVATLPTPSDTVPGSTTAIPTRSHSRRELDVASLADFSVPVAEPADISLASADLPGCVEFRVPALPGPGFPDFGVPQLPIPGLAGMPTFPDVLPDLPDLPCGPDGLPTAPTGNTLAASAHLWGGLPAPATMTRPKATVRQLSGISGTTGRLGKLANTARQQAQRIAALPQQSVHPQAPLIDQVTETPDAADTASGPTAAPRAPVTTGTDHPTSPGAACYAARPPLVFR
ncbi:ESX-1 secretion-associated protein EspA [Mycobacterium marinum]|uniref:ESX-1 secretion-associated protein EspA n=2 Tax=Mycobacterium marinum TaxID=1781 RepID=A0A3E2MS96_MYCMR|nr:ESX-1 secretion-associated protein EspA [Mycobacterium marinum]